MSTTQRAVGDGSRQPGAAPLVRNLLSDPGRAQSETGLEEPEPHGPRQLRVPNPSAWHAQDRTDTHTISRTLGARKARPRVSLERTRETGVGELTGGRRRAGKAEGRQASHDALCGTLDGLALRRHPLGSLSPDLSPHPCLQPG